MKSLYFRSLLVLLFLFGLLISNLVAQYDWQLLSNSPQNGQKQDDVFFLNSQLGWSVNGSGRIYRTTDGGDNWDLQWQRPGSYFRCVGFIDSLNGFLGNIGPNYFPGVTDPTPLYRTSDGGESWEAVTAAQITGVRPTGLCAIQVIDENHIIAAGRVGAPAYWMHSADGGQTWQSESLSEHIAMITDVYFSSPEVGYIFGGSHANIQQSKARVIRTTDGGQNWEIVYTGERTFELCWKAAFPNSETGYVTLLNYAPNYPERYFAKSENGGQSWEEFPFVNNSQKAFGIGFVDANTGWIGTDTGGYETVDGGQTWSSRSIGGYVNKIRLLREGANNWVGYAIGQRIYKLSGEGTVNVDPEPAVESQLGVTIFPNPARQNINIGFYLPQQQEVEITLYDANGRWLAQVFKGSAAAGEQSISYDFSNIPPGILQVMVRTKDSFEVTSISVLP